jgi:hypothetical protein
MSYGIVVSFSEPHASTHVPYPLLYPGTSHHDLAARALAMPWMRSSHARVPVVGHFDLDMVQPSLGPTCQPLGLAK